MCLFLLVSTIGYSQKSFGVKAGLNVTRLHVNEAHSYKVENRYGYHLGIWKEFTLSPKFSLQAELFYTLKGFKYVDTLTSPLINTLIRNKGTIIYNYLTLPVLLGYQPSSKAAIFIGPEISTLIAPFARNKGGKAHNMRLLHNYDNPDIGLTAGFRYTFTSKLSADIRYTQGFSTILEVEATDAQGNPYSAKHSKNQAA